MGYLDPDLHENTIAHISKYVYIHPFGYVFVGHSLRDKYHNNYVNWFYWHYDTDIAFYDDWSQHVHAEISIHDPQTLDRYDPLYSEEIGRDETNEILEVDIQHEEYVSIHDRYQHKLSHKQENHVHLNQVVQ